VINSLYYKLDVSLVVLGHSLCIGSDSLAVLWRAHIISLSMYVHACWSVLYRSASFCLCPVLDSEIFYLTSGWFAWRIFVSLHVNTWKWCFIHCLLLHTTTCLSNVSHFAMAVMHFALQLLIILEFFFKFQQKFVGLFCDSRLSSDTLCSSGFMDGVIFAHKLRRWGSHVCSCGLGT